MPLDELPQSLQEDLAYLQNSAESDLSMSFSHNNFFYDETISVTISASNDRAKIYYTTDGSTPTSDNEEFSHPITFVANETIACIVLKAIAIYNGEQSPVMTQSYFIGSSISERFSNYVFSISTDPWNLYDYEDGILESGKIYDDYMLENSHVEEEDWERPANYTGRGREWERPVYVEVFTQDGERVIAQNAGLRVHGNSSRINPVKSLMLIARKEYEPEAGRFKHEFFSDFSSADDFKKPILSHDSLILRPGGNDVTEGRIRTALTSRITKGTGLPTVSPQAGATVFLNGEYYSFAWLTAQINEQFLESLFSASERSFDIIAGGNTDIITEDEDMLSAFYQLLDYAEYGEGSNEAMQYFNDYFDIDEMLLFYAIRAYIADFDWPENNMMIWRYTGHPDTENSAKELDGRWHFRFYDADSSLWYNDKAAPSIRSITRLISDDMDNPVVEGRYGYSPVLKALLSNTEYTERFSNNLCDMIFEHFSTENVRLAINDLNEVSLREIEYSTLNGKASGWIDINHILESRERLIDFTKQRPDYILEEMRDIFGYTSLYQITSDGSAKINTLNGNEGFYFVENRVPITPVLSAGQAFDYWLVNGEKRHEEDLLISVADTDVHGVVNIQLVTKSTMSPLLFKDTYDTDGLCGFTMYNPTEITQNTSNLYLSDDLNNLQKWMFPILNISSGSVWEFAGKSSTSIDTLFKIGLNFNPRRGEVVFLSDENGAILDYKAIS